jgi:hypothetical protein
MLKAKRLLKILSAVVSLGLFVLTLGCSATMLVAPGKRSVSKYGPVNQKSYSNRGVVSYLNQGANFVIQNRREDAYKKMHKACNGRYRIIQEENSAGGSGAITTPVGGSYLTQTYTTVYRRIVFECIRAR